MEYVSVTQALSPFINFDNVPDYILDPATERGTKTHAITAGIARELWIPSIPPECAGYVKSFQSWFDTFVEKVIFVEKRFYHPAYQYSGQIDLYAKLKQIGYAVVDYKNPIQSYPTWKGQMAGYGELLRANKHQLDKIGTLQLNPNGKAPRMTWYEDQATDLNAFLAALTAYNHFNK